uniref:Uncharacterized protein n=1 Tax=Trichobilharzia regenti TaxID=157069 RepID=A0AA85J3R3_TRIRE|nr:unnamed protein product [Trichobilharzia regenti]
MLGSIPTAVIIFVKAVQERLALNIGLIVLAVLLLSFGIPGLTADKGLWNILSWILTMAVSFTTLIIGYRMEKLTKKASIIVLGLAGGIAALGVILWIALGVAQYPVAAKYVSALIVIFAILMVLYLTGQGIKRCGKAETDSLLPI